MTGNSAMQGAHQGAPKSTQTIFPRSEEISTSSPSIALSCGVSGCSNQLKGTELTTCELGRERTWAVRKLGPFGRNAVGMRSCEKPRVTRKQSGGTFAIKEF